MDLKENEVYKIIGKVENINTGAHFSNTTILKKDGTHVNIKLEFEQLKDIKMGKIYEFEALAVVKLEDEIILKLQSFKDIEDVLESDELSELLDYFYVYAPIPMVEIKKGIEGFLSKIENKALHDITKTIYDQHKKTFYMHPAATKFHHAYVGGLSYHTFTMLKLIDPFLEVYKYLNRDLLYAATLLHDMSKISEISGVDGEYTKEGLLIGHLVMQTIDIDQVAKQLGYEDLEEVLILKHMILSHHGQLHYGSPKKPQTGEALLLWFIDTIDSKFTVLGEVLDTTLEGQFTQMVSVLDKMRFYKPNLKK
jgi:3'-5' exoribonuclease